MTGDARRIGELEPAGEAAARFLSNPEQRRGYKVTAANARILAMAVDDELRLLEHELDMLRSLDACTIGELVSRVRRLRGVFLPLVPVGTK